MSLTRTALLLFGSTVVLFQGCGCDDRPALGEDCHTADEHTEPLTCREEGNDCLKSDGSKCTSGDSAGCSCKASQLALGAKCHTRDPRAEPLTCSGGLNKCLADDGTPCLQSHTTGCTCKPDCTAALTHEKCLANEHCKWNQQKTRRGLQEACSEETETPCSQHSSREQCLGDKNSVCIWLHRKRNRRLAGCKPKPNKKKTAQANHRSEKEGTSSKACKSDRECPENDVCINSACVRSCQRETQKTCESGLFCLDENKFLCQSRKCGCQPGESLGSQCAGFEDFKEQIKACAVGKCLTPNLEIECTSETGKSDCQCLNALQYNEVCSQAAYNFENSQICESGYWCLSRRGEDCSKDNSWKLVTSNQDCLCLEGIQEGDKCSSVIEIGQSNNQQFEKKCQEQNNECVAEDLNACKTEYETEAQCTCVPIEYSISDERKLRDSITSIYHEMNVALDYNKIKYIVNTVIDFANIERQANPFIGVQNSGSEQNKNLDKYKNKLPLWALSGVNTQWVTYEYELPGSNMEAITYFYLSVPTDQIKEKPKEQITISVHSEMIRLLHYHYVLHDNFKKDKKTLKSVAVGGGSSPCGTCTDTQVTTFFGLISQGLKEEIHASYDFETVYAPKKHNVDFDAEPFFLKYVHYVLHVHVRSLHESGSSHVVSFLEQIGRQNKKSINEYKAAFEPNNKQNMAFETALRNASRTSANNSEEKQEIVQNDCMSLTDYEFDVLNEDLGLLKKSNVDDARKQSIQFSWSLLMYDCLGLRTDKEDTVAKQVVLKSLQLMIKKSKRYGKLKA